MVGRGDELKEKDIVVRTSLWDRSTGSARVLFMVISFLPTKKFRETRSVANQFL